jgi:hypothetical protein
MVAASSRTDHQGWGTLIHDRFGKTRGTVRYPRVDSLTFGDQMTPRIAKVVFIVVAVYAGVSSCHATSHAFVKDKNGNVWLVSDTLKTHYESDGTQTQSTVCKVVIRRGRFIFNAGAFTSVDLLQSDEALLPIADVDITAHSIASLLHKYYWLPDFAPADPDISAQSATIIQVNNGVFSTRTITLSRDGRRFNVTYVLPPFIAGILHGYGDLVTEEGRDATSNSRLREPIAQHPEAELLKILQKESVLHPDTVGKPYTIFVLHKNGTVSDYSQKHVCEIPPDARHRSSRSSSRRTK